MSSATKKQNKTPTVTSGLLADLPSDGKCRESDIFFLVDGAGEIRAKMVRYSNAWVTVREFGDGIYGSGADGAATISGGTTTLTTDKYYTTLAIAADGVLITAGYRVFCSVSLTIAAGGVIHNDGAAGALGVAGVAGLAGSTAGGGAGGAGGGAGVAGTAAANKASCLGGAGGAGSAGEGPVAGAAAGTVTAPVATLGRIYGLQQMLTASVQGVTGPTAIFGGTGGGGGGGKNSGTSQGGGGGGGGGVIVIAAKSIVNAGTIRAAGGVGAAASGTAGGGGGGGGGGGVVLRVYNTITETGTCTAPLAAGGAGSGSGVAGLSGSVGLVVSLVN